jgi:hypothetical protein
MGKPVGVFSMQANTFNFLLVFAQFNGTAEIAGAMIPDAGGDVDAIEGSCDGNTITFSRKMSNSTQSYTGTPSGNGWKGSFTQPSVPGIFEWSADLAPPP